MPYAADVHALLWATSALIQCLAVLLAWHGGTVADLDQNVVADFDEQLGYTMTL